MKQKRQNQRFITITEFTVPTPGAVGGFHAAFRFAATTFFQAPDDAAVGAAIVLHLFTILPTLLLGLLRKVPAADASMRRGLWDRDPLVGGALEGRALGIVGCGAIGKALVNAVAAGKLAVRVAGEDAATDVDDRLLGFFDEAEDLLQFGVSGR